MYVLFNYYVSSILSLFVKLSRMKARLQLAKENRRFHASVYLLLTGTEGEGKSLLTELNTIPQILSTHTAGEPPDWLSGLREFVAQGIVIQSVVHSVFCEPTDPSEPVILNDIGSGIFTKITIKTFFSWQRLKIIARNSIHDIWGSNQDQMALRFYDYEIFEQYYVTYKQPVSGHAVYCIPQKFLSVRTHTV